MTGDLKTQPTEASVEAFLAAIEDPARQADCREIAAMMAEITGTPAVMWGENIIGFGRYHYRYATGREGDWFITGFSPRKQNITLYIMPMLDESDPLLASLGKFKTGKSCLYIKRLADVDREKLRELIRDSVRRLDSHIG